MQVTFYGAAGGVTGSKHLVETKGKRILLDCGMFQGRRKESAEKNKTLPFDATSIDAVVLSHAHIDHSGLLPLLVKNGFDGPIYCTDATADILKPMLLDAAHIQESDAKYFLRHKQLRRNAVHPIEPLYTTEDAEATLELLVPERRGVSFQVPGGSTVTFYNAGHVFGSAQVLLDDGERKLAFTGDLGRHGRKIIRDPEVIPEADVFLSESTYGGRLHNPMESTREELGEIIRTTAARGGKVIIPSFALERSQEILYDLHMLYDQGKVPEIPVYVDSPLTTAFTKIFEAHEEVFDKETVVYFTKKGKNPFSFDRLHHTKSVEESKRLNSFRGPCIILSSSGMCEGGRIRHHLRNHIEDPKNTILIVGYQARYTLGRRLVERAEMIKIFDSMYRVRATVEVLNGYSGHGDQTDLLKNIQASKGVEKVFLVHGDPEQAELFEKLLQAKMPNIEVSIAEEQQTREV